MPQYQVCPSCNGSGFQNVFDGNRLIVIVCTQCNGSGKTLKD